MNCEPFPCSCSLIDAFPSTPRPLVDNQGRIIAVLVGQPRHNAYREAVERAFWAIRDAGDKECFPASMRRHHRGLFAAVNVGLSYGKGQMTPGWLNNKEYTVSHLNYVCYKPPKRQELGLKSSQHPIFVPVDYKINLLRLLSLHKSHPDLRHPFAHSAFFCATFNFGRNVWMFKHRDVLNLVFGWCVIQALSHFDPRKGGHLVLWDLKLVIEFPPGTLILLPSVTIAHSNVPVQDTEERVSFTQFSASGIFRYFDNGCQTVNQLAENNPKEYDHLTVLKTAHWEEGLKLLSTIDELLTTQ
ncbi:hypothetical protein DFH09DRAFT_927467 [Mycena vulgaris]|nr:hypothetical protein DFH09DRAFT_927467 [Mycena vulgaris]